MRGGDSQGLRAYNERLIVSAIRQAGSLSKAQIARVTGLSSQGASVIVNSLLAEGLLQKMGKVRGQVGQPSTPISLNPNGAFSIGLKIGRRSLEALLVDFTGNPVSRRSMVHKTLLPEPTIQNACAQVRQLQNDLDTVSRKRIVGLGIAIPGDLHEWSDELDLPAELLAGWRGLDVARVLQAQTGLEVTLYNDATAACAAELVAGSTIDRQSALYIYVGTFVGGGVVLEGRLYVGEQSNAGSIGSMPAGGPEDRSTQLIHAASAISLERALTDAGLDPSATLQGATCCDLAARVFESWVEKSAPALARAVVSAISVIDFEIAIIDGVFPPAWRKALAVAVGAATAEFSGSGLSPVRVVPGGLGFEARVRGAALLPLNERFSPDADLVTRGLRQAAT